MATLNDFITRVRNQIRDNGTITAFSDDELTQFIQDSIMVYSKYRPRKRSFTLNLVSGQTEYQLPEDWMTVDNGSFRKAITPQPLPDPSVYALPFVYINQPLGVQVSTMDFNWYDDDQTLITGAAPFQNYTLTFDYYAFHTVNSSKSTIPTQYQYYAVLPACEKALRALATDYSVKLQKYKVGGRSGIEIDDSKIADQLLSQADDYKDQFRKEIILRPYGTAGGDDDAYRG